MTNLWHTDTLTDFNAKLYEGLLRREHIVTNEIAKKYNEDEYMGYVLEKDNPETKLKDRYFVRTEDIPLLPFKVDKWIKFSYRSEVFKFVTKCISCNIPARPDMTFRDMVDYYADYLHSNPDHFNLAKIILIAAYCERLNIRIVSEASFGKDALCDILSILNGSVSNLYNATLAKLKYALNNDFIVINELGGLKKEEIGSLQVYLTQAGAYKPVYENNSRSAKGTKESMDLRDKSHVIFHNTPEYYTGKNQLYFEQMFTPAIMDRFPGLLMAGYVQEDFSKHEPIESFQDHKLKQFIASLNYYKQFHINEKKYTIDKDSWGFTGKELQRSLRSFTIIAKYLAMYSETKQEFIDLCKLLKKCKDDYKKTAQDNIEFKSAATEEWIS